MKDKGSSSPGTSVGKQNIQAKEDYSLSMPYSIRNPSKVIFSNTMTRNLNFKT